MPADKQLRIVHRGRAYNATWRLDGKTVHVSSAYGSRSAPAKKKDAGEAVAASLLAELVEAWSPG